MVIWEIPIKHVNITLDVSWIIKVQKWYCKIKIELQIEGLYTSTGASSLADTTR